MGVRYWLYENRRIDGPFDAHSLPKMPGFRRRSLVCPENRTGRAPTDWLPAECVEELAWRGGRDAGNVEVATPELDGVARVLAALEMRLLSLETREAGPEGRAGPQLVALKEQLAEVASRLDAVDDKSQGLGPASAAVRESIQSLKTKLEHLEEREGRTSHDLLGRMGDVEKGLREARSSSDELARSLDETLRRSLDAIETKTTRTESALGARLTDLKNSLDFSEAERSAGVSSLTEALERLRRGVASIQSRLAGVEERTAKAEGEAGHHEDLKAELAHARAALARLEEEQQHHRAHAERVEAERIDEVKARLAELQAAFSRIEQQATQAAAETHQQAMRVEPFQAALSRLEGSISDVAAGLRRLEETALAQASRPAEPAPIQPAPVQPAPPAAAPPWHAVAFGLAGIAVGGVAVFFVSGGPRPAPVAPVASVPVTQPEAPAPLPFSSPTPEPPAPSRPPEPVAAVEPVASPAPVEPPAAPEPVAALPPAPVEPPPASVRKKRIRVKVAPAVAPVETPAAAVKPAPAALPGATQLMEARAEIDGLDMVWTREREPEIVLKQDPPRILLEFTNAKSLLASEDVGGFPPHILAVRVTDEPRNRVFVEVLLDAPASYKLAREGPNLKLVVPYEPKF